MKVLITDSLDLVCHDLLAAAGIEAATHLKASEDELRALAADGWIIRSGTTITAELLDAAHGLKVIGRAGVGVDNVDLGAATRKGGVVTPHLAASTGEAQEKVARQVTEQVIEALHGRPVATPVNAGSIRAAAQPEAQPFIARAARIGQKRMYHRPERGAGADSYARRVRGAPIALTFFASAFYIRHRVTERLPPPDEIAFRGTCSTSLVRLISYAPRRAAGAGSSPDSLRQGSACFGGPGERRRPAKGEVPHSGSPRTEPAAATTTHP